MWLFPARFNFALVDIHTSLTWQRWHRSIWTLWCNVTLGLCKWLMFLREDDLTNYLFVTMSNAKYFPAFELHVSEDIKGTEEDESPEDDECDEAHGVHMQTMEVEVAHYAWNWFNFHECPECPIISTQQFCPMFFKECKQKRNIAIWHDGQRNLRPHCCWLRTSSPQNAPDFNWSVSVDRKMRKVRTMRSYHHGCSPVLSNWQRRQPAAR